MAPLASVRGALAHSRLQINMRWTYIALATTIAIIVFNNLVWRSPLVNFIAPSPIAIVLFYASAIMLLRAPPDDAVNAGNFMAAVMIFSATVWGRAAAGSTALRGGASCGAGVRASGRSRPGAWANARCSGD